MKKLLMIFILLLGLAGAGAGYYLFYYKPHQEQAQKDKDALQKKSASAIEEGAIPQAEETSRVTKPEVMNYYVEAATVGVRERPEMDAFVHRLLYRGEKVYLYEKTPEWGRLSPYFVYQEGGPEVAEWIPLQGLAEQAPIITPEERYKTVLSYISDSDDLPLFEEIFIEKTDQLLTDGTCAPRAFKELGGWMRSVRYQDSDVYFIYCGGYNQTNKIYLNVQNGHVFYQ
ncbi:hypothetical protein EXA21_10845 [Vibrio cincinnatiensis]|uniref:hypothetical protein n=1 Tax=Vibrio cincinnatiensis TaxID=675 RepID=UPI001EDDAB01|nr:hypothetical protein [Vibrio cincinnatiensis]MCG3760052.1 hypothetical protein [Vibrio cincinnatiensis]MCG3763359.1 hypothetical protein [Vibrio cincinnatiensis]